MEPLLPLLQLLGLVYCFVLPGWLIAIQLGEEWSGLVRLAVGATLGLLIVPITCFAAAWLMETNIQPPLVVGISTGINALALAVLVIRFSIRPDPEEAARGEHPEAP